MKPDRERQLLELFQQAPGFVAFLVGPDHVFELANEAYFELVGRRDILHKSVRDALPELAGQGFYELLDGVFATNTPFTGRAMRVELTRVPDAPPEEAYVDLVYQPIVDEAGTVTGIFVQGHDVSELKRHEAQRQAAEAALVASEQRYRSLFETLDDGFAVIEVNFDAQGRSVDYTFLETNEAFVHHTDLVDVVGKRMRDLVPDHDEHWFTAYGRVATTGVTERFELRAEAMGRVFEVSARRIGEPTLRHVAVLFKDVSQRRRVEEEREDALRRASAALEEAEAASRLRDDFLATVSHELRTPLSSMLGWVQMLRAGTLPEDKRERGLEAIERNARTQAKLIADLLDVSSVLAGKLQLELVPVNMASATDAALAGVRVAATAKQITLHARLEAGIVQADATRVQQMASNLLSNAIKFTPAGGDVYVEVERRDAFVELVVRDTGPGIPAAFQPHLFSRFRQAQSGISRAHGGMGLGLAIVDQLAQLQGGTVQAESTEQGSTFTIRLPASESMQLASTPPEALQPLPDLHGLHVLLVEDEPDTREMVATLLEGRGARVRRADSAASGFDLFQRERPDLLLSDIGMPDEDGYSFMRRIRQLPADAGGMVPAVALTAFAQDADRQKALGSGFSRWLTKPVDPGALVQLLASIRPQH